MAEPFIAEIKIFAGNFAPRGFAFCDGRLLPISQNTALFSLVGTIYGGDGRTTFGIPNLQGKAPMHPGNGPGLTPRRLGERGGVEAITLSQAQLTSHSHAAQSAMESATAIQISNEKFLGTKTEKSYADGTPTDMSPESLDSVGGGASHINMQPFLAMNFIIALTGIFPSRS